MGKLVWIASYPKSGSTWLRAFLHNFIREPGAPYQDINRLMDLSTGESGASLYRRHDPRPASQYSIADVQRMRPLVHRDLTQIHPDLVFVKTHNASLVVHDVPLVTPEATAGAIYIVRDPRDVAVSYSHHIGKSLDETIAIMADPEAATGGDDTKLSIELLASWSESTCISGPAARRGYHPVLRYEDMLHAPSGAFGDVIRFLGMEPPAERLRRAIAFSSFETLREWKRGRGSRRPRPPPTPVLPAGRSGQWRETLTEKQRARIEQDHGREMRRFGYLG